MAWLIQLEFQYFYALLLIYSINLLKLLSLIARLTSSLSILPSAPVPFNADSSISCDKAKRFDNGEIFKFLSSILGLSAFASLGYSLLGAGDYVGAAAGAAASPPSSL